MSLIFRSWWCFLSHNFKQKYNPHPPPIYVQVPTNPRVLLRSFKELSRDADAYVCNWPECKPECWLFADALFQVIWIHSQIWEGLVCTYLILMWIWKWKSLSHLWLFATPWTVQSMEFSRPECWSGKPFPSPGHLPNLGIKPRSPTLQADSLPAEPPSFYLILWILIDIQCIFII